MDLVRHTTVSKKVNEILNRLNKTKKEVFPDLKAQKEVIQKAVYYVLCLGCL